MSEPTTPRRSRRGQPVVVDDRFASPPPTASADVVPSRLLHSRQSHPSDLLYNEDPDNAPVDTYRTHFYHAFSCKSGRQPSTRAPTRTYGKVARPRRSDPDAADVFTVGDTVLIRASATSKIPSVAVIMAIWKVEGDDLPPNAPLRVLVHWFVRPNELPKHRVRRDEDGSEGAPSEDEGAGGSRCTGAPARPFASVLIRVVCSRDGRREGRRPEKQTRTQGWH
ncbi:hypothetical protein LXA43DRAFT_1049106 [Ganoderma leucocontextum]|nr:hypothetical protein LXA43DRAFT_1049070 [Ganoderma leucocontextum]KAI1782909.1 hypothetical protein LXA43DRAFT_1049088 [Ganoderma leucocontextum]KAI1782912.1 hypothetical protein LXA43DRAFT_1049106 [Ganoderma leucocontextum]